MEHKDTYNSESEIDLLKLYKTIIKGKKTVIRFIVYFGLIGLFIALFQEKEFTASTTVVPQVSGKKVGGNLGGLAAMAGINLGEGNSGSIPPSLYPEIVQSVPFKKELLDVSIKFSGVNKMITYREYYEDYKSSNILSVIKSYTIGLPGKIFSLFKNKPSNITEVGKDSIYRVSIEDNNLFKQLDRQLIIENNKNDGFIKIYFSMPEALPSAQMTKKVQELLQKAVTNFKIQKTKDEFKFIEERYSELKKDFSEKQAVLASFRDRNQGLVTSRSQSRLESLQSEYNLAYNVYSELAKQLEQQKIKLKENTPVFTTIEPVSVPVTKSSIKGILVLVVWLFLGVILGVGSVFGRKWINDFKMRSQ
ncbi:Wzz/FepE/Etk N-terminal domain-containing protein [Tenacibaculum ovolyticum]|uniref:Wzz/FepE/Etk N-terminal domain-containing protein n=1 Tax=Tenacibaculum ovolyticum TaxID=104270 RepID=UPI0022F406E4|nr:Wzz/FepE/Etk N-terminal domain-containing protein [Tenacibaculum ovolyticum]WBX76172.1 Wzz/FepE/Etk N-terminal domain-containing protein [Tenacibaculum ovolyticum]